LEEEELEHFRIKRRPQIIKNIAKLRLAHCDR
jgi:transposase